MLHDCHNVGTTLQTTFIQRAGNFVKMLWQYCKITKFSMLPQHTGNVAWTEHCRPSKVQHSHNISATLSQRCGNVVKLHVFQHCHSIHTMLCLVNLTKICHLFFLWYTRCCLWADQSTILPQLWHNDIIFDIATIFLQHCRNTLRIRNLIFHPKNKV